MNEYTEDIIPPKTKNSDSCNFLSQQNHWQYNFLRDYLLLNFDHNPPKTIVNISSAKSLNYHMQATQNSNVFNYIFHMLQLLNILRKEIKNQGIHFSFPHKYQSVHKRIICDW